MLYEILASVTHNPHYLTKYITFISNCQKKNESYSGYTEQHHICPKAQDMFPEFTSFKEFPWNCAKLTPRQHFIAHLLLMKSYPSFSGAVQGFAFFLNAGRISKLYSNYRVIINATIADMNKEKVTVIDNNGKTFRVDVNDSRFLSGELVGHTKGMVAVKDTNNTFYQVSLLDTKYLSGELVGVNKGKVTVKDILGNTSQVEITDSKYLSGELVHVFKGLVSVKDNYGNKFKVSKTDSRFISGELVGQTKDTISLSRALNISQVREIRLAIKNPTTVITNDYLATIVKKSQKDKISVIPFEELKFTNGRFVTYRILIANYYAEKFKMRNKNILSIIDNKTYREITV